MVWERSLTFYMICPQASTVCQHHHLSRSWTCHLFVNISPHHLKHIFSLHSTETPTAASTTIYFTSSISHKILELEECEQLFDVYGIIVQPALIPPIVITYCNSVYSWSKPLLLSFTESLCVSFRLFTSINYDILIISVQLNIISACFLLNHDISMDPRQLSTLYMINFLELHLNSFSSGDFCVYFTLETCEELTFI